RRPTVFNLFCLWVRPGEAPTLISIILSRVRPGPYLFSPLLSRVRPSSPTLIFLFFVSGCAPAHALPDLSILCRVPPAHPYSLFPLFCLWLRPGEALHLVYPVFFCLGCALSPVQPGAPSFHTSVSGCAPAQPYT
ncbi:hypothetical protein CDAR_67261, partial [Caerostris darwini]